MKVIEKSWEYGPIKAYSNVELQFLNFTKDVRVLPAPFFEQPNTHFTLKNKYLPGENKHFPNGGFEVEGFGGAYYAFDLDQVIVHPYALKMDNFFDKIEEGKEINTKINDGVKRKRGRPSIEGSVKGFPKYVPNGGKRGRQPLSPEEKAKREAIKDEKKLKSGGKRGRPKSIK